MPSLYRSPCATTIFSPEEQASEPSSENQTAFLCLGLLLRHFQSKWRVASSIVLPLPSLPSDTTHIPPPTTKRTKHRSTIDPTYSRWTRSSPARPHRGYRSHELSSFHLILTTKSTSRSLRTLILWGSKYLPQQPSWACPRPHS